MGVAIGTLLTWGATYVQSTTAAHQEFKRARLAIAYEIDINMAALGNDDQHLTSEIDAISSGMYDIRPLFSLRHTAMDLALTRDSFSNCPFDMLTAISEVAASLDALNLGLETRSQFTLTSPSISNFGQRLEAYDRMILPTIEVSRQALGMLDRGLRTCKWKNF